MIIALSHIIPGFDANEAKTRQLERSLSTNAELSDNQEQLRQQIVNRSIGLGRTDEFERFTNDELRSSDQLRFAEDRIEVMISDIEDAMRPVAGWAARQANIPELRSQQIQGMLERFNINSSDLNSDLMRRLESAGLESRKIGTLQATGMRSEPRDTVTQIHAGERVLNPTETQEYNSRSSNDSQTATVKKLDELNTSMLTMIKLMNQEISIQSRTMNTISGLGPDLMKGIPN